MISSDPPIPDTTTAEAAHPQAAPLAAAALIADEARRAPDKPGVYRMYGEDGSCLYVGKAKDRKSVV